MAEVSEQPAQLAEAQNEAPGRDQVPAFRAVDADGAVMANPAAAESGPAAAGYRADVPQAAPLHETSHLEAAPATFPQLLETERVIEQMQDAAPARNVPQVPVTLEPISLPPGLELIETDPDKLRIAAGRIEPPPPPRPPRVRPTPPPVSNEPLVQVETTK